jgi:hypothetical protein
MKPNRPLKLLLPVAMFCAMSLLTGLSLATRPVTGSHTDGASEETTAAQDAIAAVQVTIGPNVPHDVPQGMRLPYNEQSETVLAAFAWQQFLALCWQSDYNTTSFSRGAPDTNWNYKLNYKKGQPLVWETYAHRSELRPFGIPLNQPFSKAPQYIFKQTTPPNKIIPAGNAEFDLFNNLDEDSEIGSCDIYLGPGDPKSQHIVLYQAKVNQAEYDYIKTSFGATQHDPGGLLAQAQKANMSSIKQTKAPAPNGISLPAGDNSVSGVKGEGAIEIKTAFLLVTPQNQEQLKDFFQTQAIYYTATYDETTKSYSNWQYHNGTFALLAIHVIHKTKSYPDFIFTSFEHVKLASMPFQYILLTPPPPIYPGSNFNPFNAAVPTPKPPDGTQFGMRHLIKRQQGTSPVSNGQLYPIPPYLDAVTKTVHDELAKLNPNSVWLNYRLMGVQANITEKWTPKPDAGLLPPNTIPSGPNHFMANHVVESDAFLGNFFGPGFGSNPFPTGPKNGQGKQNGDNVLYKGKTFNMGGCKGCHGVAQTAFGTDFSFLLDFVGDKPVDDPDTIIYHPKEQ